VKSLVVWGQLYLLPVQWMIFLRHTERFIDNKMSESAVYAALLETLKTVCISDYERVELERKTRDLIVSGGNQHRLRQRVAFLEQLRALIGGMIHSSCLKSTEQGNCTKPSNEHGIQVIAMPKTVERETIV